MSAAKPSRPGTSAKEAEPPKDGPEAERMFAARAGDVIFRDMSRDEIEAMLLRNRVGRLAFSLHDRVDIQPIHYIYERGWLYGRTSEETRSPLSSTTSGSHSRWMKSPTSSIGGAS